MKKLFFLVMGILLVQGCSRQNSMGPDLLTDASGESYSQRKPEAAALEAVTYAGWSVEENLTLPEGVDPALAKKMPADQVVSGRIIAHNRQPIRGNIVHYSFQVQTGPGRYDVIGLHRVVKEKRAHEPIRTHRNLLYLHGDAKDFCGMMLPGQLAPSMPDDFGLAVFLAENDVDVWGIDQAWTLVPAEESDFTFMKDWGLQRQVDDLEYAMSIARFIRLFTGSGFDQLLFGGYSSGVLTGYALLNQETQLLPRHRNAAGFVAFDCVYKTNRQDVHDALLMEYNRTKALLDAGQYGDFVPFQLIAQLARTDPDGDSPLIPGFTNNQAALFFAAGNIFVYIPFHYFGGFWENDLPVSLRYVTIDECYDFMAAGVPWETAVFINDYCKIVTDVEETPFDDHLGQITVPILNISPGGSFCEQTVYTTTLLGSGDITHLMPQLLPPEERLYDFGHIDIFLSQQARGLIWEPLLQWINGHTSTLALN